MEEIRIEAIWNESQWDWELVITEEERNFDFLLML